VVILGIRAAVSGVWVWVRHNRLRDVGGIFWRNNNVLSGGDSIDRIRGVELSKGSALKLRAPAKGSALKPGSKGAMPPYLNRRVNMGGKNESIRGAKKWGQKMGPK
jgi:hypothetical protein